MVMPGHGGPGAGPPAAPARRSCGSGGRGRGRAALAARRAWGARARRRRIPAALGAARGGRGCAAGAPRRLARRLLVADTLPCEPQQLNVQEAPRRAHQLVLEFPLGVVLPLEAELAVELRGLRCVVLVDWGALNRDT